MPSAFSLFLATKSSEKIFFEPLNGNNGDRLIRMGMQELFSQHKITSTETPDEADIILLCGGGACNDEWPTGAAQVLETYLKRFPHKEIIVGPSSYHFRELDFAGIVNQTRSKVTLFSREQISHQLLKDYRFGNHVSLAISQDLAFELAQSPFIEEQINKSRNDLFLCALRKDREGDAGILAKTSASWLPDPIRIPLSRLRDRLVANRKSGVINEVIARMDPKVETSNIFYRDVSVSVDFQTFCQNIRETQAILTNRLHIAILGSLLNKEVYLIPGSYHKIEGVYNYSLKEKQNIHLLAQ